jgi:glycosyltransferase involved in cell wall biosynthesis
MIDQLKVALVHDWLTGMRGGEKALEVFCELYPQADLFTLLHNPGSVSKLIENRPIHTSFINRLPGKATKYRYYLPLFPTAIELFNFKGYDIILSTSHCVAKGVRTPPGALHISYLHTPMRYVWDMYEEYFGEDKTGAVQRKIIPLFANYLRMWDVTSSNRVDFFIANSGHVAKRIRKYYRREATVLYGPADTGRFPVCEQKGDFYLIISALVPYKRIDLAIKVFNQSGKPLHIVGSGPEGERLKKMAGRSIRFFDRVSAEKLLEHYAACKALIFPGEEDLGLVPIEAQSCGKPVIAYGKGGALETVIGYNGSNEKQCSGIFFPEQSEAALQQAIDQLESLSWDSRFIHTHAQKFSRERFAERIKAYIEEKVREYF